MSGIQHLMYVFLRNQPSILNWLVVSYIFRKFSSCGSLRAQHHESIFGVTRWKLSVITPAFCSGLLIQGSRKEPPRPARPAWWLLKTATPPLFKRGILLAWFASPRLLCVSVTLVCHHSKLMASRRLDIRDDGIWWFRWLNIGRRWTLMDRLWRPLSKIPKCRYGLVSMSEEMSLNNTIQLLGHRLRTNS